MSTSQIFLVISTFLACGVEMVEALTIVLATGITRGWRSTLLGTLTALVALTVIVAVFGPAMAQVPIATMQIIVGSLMLVFGLQWLRKAMLRSAGRKALHDEDKIFVAEQQTAREQPIDARQPVDWYGFTLTFKGVFLEGLEVAFIVVTFGTAQQRIDLAAYGALAALAIVVVAGLVLHKPLSRVPENSLKYVVGLLLTSFGTYWTAEGLGVEWPGGDIALLVILVVYGMVSAYIVQRMRAVDSGFVLRFIERFVRFWYEFIIGDDWRNAAATGVAVVLTIGALAYGVAAFWIFPVVVIVYLVSLLRTT
ncbi:MAG: hypothetical protein RLZZ297_1934 [Chloroflexota bacterium]